MIKCHQYAALHSRSTFTLVDARRDFKIARDMLYMLMNFCQILPTGFLVRQENQLNRKPAGAQRRYGGDSVIFSSHRSQHAWETG